MNIVTTKYQDQKATEWVACEMRHVEATDDSTMIGQAKNGDGDGDRRSKGRKVNTIGKATGFLVDERR